MSSNVKSLAANLFGHLGIEQLELGEHGLLGGLVRLRQHGDEALDAADGVLGAVGEHRVGAPAERRLDGVDGGGAGALHRRDADADLALGRLVEAAEDAGGSLGGEVGEHDGGRLRVLGGEHLDEGGHVELEEEPEAAVVLEALVHGFGALGAEARHEQVADVVAAALHGPALARRRAGEVLDDAVDRRRRQVLDLLDLGGDGGDLFGGELAHEARRSIRVETHHEHGDLGRAGERLGVRGVGSGTWSSTDLTAVAEP